MSDQLSEHLFEMWSNFFLIRSINQQEDLFCQVKGDQLIAKNLF